MERSSSWLTGCSQADETVWRTVKLKSFIFFPVNVGHRAKVSVSEAVNCIEKNYSYFYWRLLGTLHTIYIYCIFIYNYVHTTTPSPSP